MQEQDNWLNGAERLGVALLSVIASVAILAGTVLVFYGDGQTPWFRADSPSALLAQRCDGLQVNDKHQCLRVVASGKLAPTLALANKDPKP